MEMLDGSVVSFNLISALAVATCQIAIGARLGYDPDVEELGAGWLPVLRARNLQLRVRR
jgi:hypothetical protein